MSQTTETTTTTKTTSKTSAKKATAPVKTAAKKPAAVPAPTKSVKTAAKKPVAAPKAETKPEKETIRLRVFTLLAQHPDGMSGAEIKTELELGGIPALLKDEGIADNPRIKRGKSEGTRGAIYQLTPLGKKAVEKGTVDSEAAVSAKGKEWPEGR